MKLHRPRAALFLLFCTGLFVLEWLRSTLLYVVNYILYANVDGNYKSAEKFWHRLLAGQPLWSINLLKYLLIACVPFLYIVYQQLALTILFKKKEKWWKMLLYYYGAGLIVLLAIRLAGFAVPFANQIYFSAARFFYSPLIFTFLFYLELRREQLN
ncbi:MAG: hypothetical protein V4616_06530, partial [Bacteroidota bacterium]